MYFFDANRFEVFIIQKLQSLRRLNPDLRHFIFPFPSEASMYFITLLDWNSCTMQEENCSVGNFLYFMVFAIYFHWFAHSNLFVQLQIFLISAKYLNLFVAVSFEASAKHKVFKHVGFQRLAAVPYH